jgi:hypothetical protein
MIRAHMATYPKRRELLLPALESILPQVDRLFLVMNEYPAIPEEIAGLEKVEAVIPETDLKDVGKFLPTPAPEDLVLFVDDDLVYAPTYAEQLILAAERIGLDQSVFGYHGSIYPNVANLTLKDRHVFPFYKARKEAVCVDQLGSGVMLALGRNVPPLSYMMGSQKFVDVRYARWLCEQGVKSWCLARSHKIADELRVSSGRHETIFKTFTRNSPDHVIAEIVQFAGKGLDIGKRLGADNDGSLE